MSTLLLQEGPSDTVLHSTSLFLHLWGSAGSSGLHGERPLQPPACPEAPQGSEWRRVFKAQAAARQRAQHRTRVCPVRTPIPLSCSPGRCL